MTTLKLRWQLWRARPAKYKLKQVPNGTFALWVHGLFWLAGTIGRAALAVGCFIYITMAGMQLHVAQIKKEAYDQARADAAAEFAEGWKERLKTDADLQRSVCTSWWFTASAAERKLK